MALEFICSEIIESGKRIKIPKGANCYRLKSERIKFFRANPKKRFMEIPIVAREVSFDMEGNSFTIEYGEPRFYDSAGNDLKTMLY